MMSATLAPIMRIALLCAHLMLASSSAEASWFPAAVPMIDDVDMTAVDSLDGQHGLAVGTYGAVFATFDGGLTWVSQHSGTRESLVSTLMLDRETGMASRKSIYVGSVNHGAWSANSYPVANDDTFYSLSRCGDTGVCTLRGGSIYRSVTNGTTFLEVHSSESGLPFGRIVFPSKSIGFAFGGQTSDASSVGIIAKTVDGGVHWSELEVHASEFLVVSFFTTLHGLAISAEGDLLETTDGAATWHAIITNLPGVYPLDLKCRGQKECSLATLYGEIYSTRDAGATWHLEHVDDYSRAINAISSDARIAVGSGGLILVNDQIYLGSFEN